jgi:hypothetical protein
MIALDMNRDARPDLVLSETQLNAVSIVFGKGGGALESDRRFNAGLFPRTLLLRDLNADSKLDLLVLNFQSKDIMVFHGMGNGQFEKKDTLAVSDFPRAMALGDLNNDNKLDLLVTNVTLGRVSVFLGDGLGGFGIQTLYSVREGGGTSGVEPRSIAVGDVNKDGNLDAVTANVKSDSISVMLGDGAGKLGAATEFFMGNFPLDVHLSDLNGDGNLDAVATNGLDPAISNAAQPRVSVMFGLGDGSFDLDSRKQYSTGDVPVALALADITLDGIPDAITLHTSGNFAYLLKGLGAGQFAGGVPESVGQFPAAFALADINRDGRLDMVSVNADETISVMINRGNLNFDPPMNFFAGADPTAVALGDVNGDGLVDVVYANQTTNDIGVILGRPLS